MFQVSLKAVDNWWAKWLAGEREALAAQPRGRRAGEHQVLGAVEQQAVRQAVLDQSTWGWRGSRGRGPGSGI